MNRLQGAYPVMFGEVLFDHFPDGHAVLGGAPFNVAWHLQAFAKAPVLVSRVGNDPLGHQIRQSMESQAMSTAGLQLDSRHPTGTVDVTFNDSEPSYDIVENRAWDFINDRQLPPLDDIALLYHGSLALRNPVSRRAFDVIRQHGDVPVFIDINLRTPWWTRDDALSLLQRARWAKMNEGELALLLPELDEPEKRAKTLLNDYALEWILVTLGDKGAQAYTAAGEILSVAPDRSTAIVDTVGAGDAFASVLILGLLKDWPMQLTLQRAQDFASSIVGVRGATVSDTVFYRSFFKDWDLV
ncbi:MAG TPA: carbohydrate kinase [Gammaproteobacteria bacterium]|nr:carbohydrate kinase [Gammaproteobacteria bacterium]